MSRLGGAVPDYHIIAPEPASWALGGWGSSRAWDKDRGGKGRDPDCPSFSAQEADMPDEVNIDELLELESEEERSRKIQVGGRESRT